MISTHICYYRGNWWLKTIKEDPWYRAVPIHRIFKHSISTMKVRDHQCWMAISGYFKNASHFRTLSSNIRDDSFGHSDHIFTGNVQMCNLILLNVWMFNRFQGSDRSSMTKFSRWHSLLWNEMYDRKSLTLVLYFMQAVYKSNVIPKLDQQVIWRLYLRLEG